MAGSATKKKIFQYDVFHNHRGPETKQQFVVPLIDKLHEAGIQRSFLDTQNIHHGEGVFEVIQEALESARMHIAYFSKNYAHSKYCLSELKQMFLTGRPLITVFYDVEPGHVRRPRIDHGPYAEAFRIHSGRENPEVVECWVTALEKAADIRGFERSKYGGDDELLAKDIVEQVVRILSPTTVTIPPRMGHYDWGSHHKLPTKGQGIVFFAADTHKNLHITFSPEAGDEFPSYEIVIDGQQSWEHLRAEIRRLVPDRVVCSYSRKDLSDPPEEGDLYHFWICVDARTKLIYVGRGKHIDEKDAFIIFKDPEFLQDVQYFAFSSNQAAITYTGIRVEPRRVALLGNYGQDSSSPLWSCIDASQVPPPLEDVALSESENSSGDYNGFHIYGLPTKGRGIVCFSAKTITAVHVAISTRPQSMDETYEIVIGQWGNAECVIRKKGQRDTLCRVISRGVIELGQVNQFWVSINADTQLVHVGAGNVPNVASVICIYKDPCFINEARFVSFFSDDAKCVISNVVVASPSATKLLSPQPLAILARMGKYDWDPSYKLMSEGKGTISFAADASTDVHVAISSRCETMDPMYEIVIGGWDNTRSGIRKRSQGEVLWQVNEGLQNTNCLHQLWVSVDKDTQLIEIGRGDQANRDSVILKAKDPTFLSDVQYIAFSTLDAPITYSSISVSIQSVTVSAPIQNVAMQEPLQSANIRLQEPTSVVMHERWGRYQWQHYFELPLLGRGVILFAAETITDVHVAISPLPRTVDPMYEIVIGGWNNSMSVIRRASKGIDLVSVKSERSDPPIAPGLNHYWVSIDASNKLVKAGKGKRPEIESSVFLLFKDSNFIREARYVTFTTFDAPVTYSDISVKTIQSSANPASE